MEYTEVVPQRFDFRPEFKFLLGFSRGMCKYGYPTYPFDKRFRIFVKDLFDNATIAKGFPPDIYEEIEIIKRNIESYFDDDIGIVYDPEWKVFQNDFFRIYSQGKEYNKPDYYPWIKKNKGYSEDIYCFGENILSAISPLFESLNNDEYMRLGKFLSNLYGVCNDYESSFVTSLDKYYNECVVYFPEIAAKISTQCKFDGEKEFGKWKDDIDFAFNLVCEFGMGKIEEIQEIEFENFPVLSKTWDIFRESLKAIECDTRSAKHTKTPPPSHNQCPISPAREHVHQDSSNENCQSTKSDQSYDHIIEFKKRPLSPQDAGIQYGRKFPSASGNQGPVIINEIPYFFAVMAYSYFLTWASIEELTSLEDAVNRMEELRVNLCKGSKRGHPSGEKKNPQKTCKQRKKDLIKEIKEKCCFLLSKEKSINVKIIISDEIANYLEYQEPKEKVRPLDFSIEF